MAQSPTLTDYADVIMELFTRFEQDRTENEAPKLGRPFSYSERAFILFFVMMQHNRISNFKAQRRWLEARPDAVNALGWTRTPHRATISRRFKDLYETVKRFIVFIARRVSDQSGESGRFDLSRLVEDKSLFRARGPVWHQKHRQEGYVPEGLRDVDTDATWSRSSYHGWVYGYAIHATCNEDAFAVMVSVETASVSESAAFDRKERDVVNILNPKTLTADDACTKAMRVRRWFKRGGAFITPALRWKKGRYAREYQRFIKLPESAERLKRRRTSVEPLFDLIGKATGTDAGYRQLPVKGIDNARSFLIIGSLSVQIAMIVNHRWGLPHRAISKMTAVLR